MVLQVRFPSSNPSQMLVELVDGSGHVAASAQFSPPAKPVVGGCVMVLPPPVRVAAGAVFYADSAGTVHRLDPNGTITQVASFPITSAQLLSFAVSPDGQKLMAILFGTPGSTGHWTLDLESATAGGSTTNVLHKDFGQAPPTPGPTLMAGWDDAGPVATLNSTFCVQNSIPSSEYTGSSLIHLGADGTHLDTIGGAGCAAWDEQHDGTVICGGSDWSSFSVRTRTGAVEWSRSAGGFVLEPRLSPKTNGVTVNGDHEELFLQGSGTPATVTSKQGAVYILGWFGSNDLVVLQAGTHLGLVKATNVSSVKDLGLTVQTSCTQCVPNAAAIVGTLGNP
ncbi:MAG TPA: hypothetical protein VER07_00695 [Candidatus Polarisedimenticolia bacterium]|nr:hypothetical protein [Candidatus Polarisedimenticolia bacterium]